jgi:hypothetical protein
MSDVRAVLVRAVNVARLRGCPDAVAVAEDALSAWLAVVDEATWLIHRINERVGYSPDDLQAALRNAGALAPKDEK